LPPGAGSAPTPSPPGLNPNLEIRLAHLFTPTSGWALTTDRVLTTADGGVTWADVTPPGIIATASTTSSLLAPGSAPSVQARILQTAFFLNPTQAWAVVSGPVVTTTCGLTPLELFSSVDGGRHWSSTRMTPTTQCDTAGPVYLTFIDATRGWLIVDQGSHAGFTRYTGFRTTDGGLTWTSLDYPQSAPLLFVSRLDGFSVGSGYPQSGAFATHDGGLTWKRLALGGLPSHARSSAFELPQFADSQHGVLGGQVMDPSGTTAAVVFYQTSDAGRTWQMRADVPNPDPQRSAQPLGAVSPKSWLAAFFVAGPVAGKTYTRLKLTKDAGRTWEWQPLLVTGGFQSQPSFAGSTGWGIVVDSACRAFKTDCYTNWALLQTLDAGGHWTPMRVT
jgi:photosystem II stability/assembly factor-like uncharacterized protein